MRDPGLDLHEWESRFRDLEERLQDDPREALAELGDLVNEMLEESGFAVDDPVADDGVSPEVLAEFRAAHETQQRVERGEDVDPGDLGAAVNGFRAVFDLLTTQRPAEATGTNASGEG